MTTVKNNSGSKLVHIRTNADSFRATHCQIYKGDESVIQAKSFATEKKAITWANKVLS